MIKNLPANAGDAEEVSLIPLSGRSLGDGNTAVFLPGKSQEHKSLSGYSPWCHKASDTSEPLSNKSLQITDTR